MRRTQKTRVIARRTLENYLISAGAISYAIEMEIGLKVITDTVGAWIVENLPTFAPDVQRRWPTDTWENYVDAPRLLASAFDELSGSTLEFRKTRHSVMLLAWRMEHEADDLHELIEHVSDLIGQPMSA